ncbi:MAG: hypothetical protein NXH72_14665 [Hyphomonadaceae bacterium]|nr:hypothetical protein [Hyphomonadaceae bacterium]
MWKGLTVVAGAAILSGCQLTVVTDENKAHAACAEADDPTACFEVKYADLREIRERERAVLDNGYGGSPTPPMRRSRVFDESEP